MQQHRPDLFDSGEAAASGEGLFAEVDIDDGAGPGSVRMKRRRQDLK
jgi:hypothetical protein